MITMKLADANATLYQWDTGQRLLITGANAGDRADWIMADHEPLSTRLYQDRNLTYTDIPNILLQTSGSILVYIYSTVADTGETVACSVLRVLPRPKPEDYIYTETEVETWSALNERMNDLVSQVESLYSRVEELEQGDTPPVTVIPDIDGFVWASNGSVVTSDPGTSKRTDYVSLDGVKRIQAVYRVVSSRYALAFFDSEKRIMTDVSIAGAGTSKDNKIDMKPPKGAAYCILSHWIGSSGTYTGSLTLIYTDPIELEGVTVNILGDSISSVAYAIPNYWQLISDTTNCIFNDYAVAASRIATVEGDKKESFLTRAARMSTDADAVLVMGGTNDVGLHTVLGEWDSTDVSTFYGALNKLIGLLCENFPGKPIIFCTPIKRKYDGDSGFPKTMVDLASADPTTQLTMEYCVLAIKAKCTRHGIPVIDLAEHSGISPETPEYYRAQDDNLHPSVLGHVRIANMVQAELERQFSHR